MKSYLLFVIMLLAYYVRAQECAGVIISLDIAKTNVLCYDSNNGSIMVNAFGGESPYSYSWSNGASSETINNLDRGNYTLTVTDANGCTVSNVVTITEPSELLATTGIIRDESVCGAGDGLIRENVTAGVQPYSYVWSNGQTSHTVTNVTAGDYFVTVTDANGCTTTATATVTCATGITNTAAAQISIYPNPATNLLYVNVPVGNNYTISIHDVAGRLIKEQNLTQQLTELYLGDIVQGMYTVEVKTQQGITKVERLVVR